MGGVSRQRASAAVHELIIGSDPGHLGDRGQMAAQPKRRPAQPLTRLLRSARVPAGGVT